MQNKKKSFESPSIEIIVLSQEDIVTASDGGIDLPFDPWSLD